MKYKFTAHLDLLPLVLEVYKKTGGYFEVTSNGDHSVTVISDNEEFLYHDDFRELKNATPITPVRDSSEVIRKEVMDVIQELLELPIEIKTVSGPVTFSGVDVNKIKLQRSKFMEKRFFKFKLEKRRAKWELIKILQEEFDKFPDDTVFTSFSVFGVGAGRNYFY